MDYLNTGGKRQAELLQSELWLPGPSLMLVGHSNGMERHKNIVRRHNMFPAYFYEIKPDRFASWNIPKDEQEAFFYRNEDATLHNVIKEPLVNIDFDSDKTFQSVFQGSSFKLSSWFVANVPRISTTFSSRNAYISSILGHGETNGLRYVDFLTKTFPQYKTFGFGYKSGGDGNPMFITCSILK